jgi:hypothetical protein
MVAAVDPSRAGIVVIDPALVTHDLRRALCERRALLFDSVDAFDAWRMRSRPGDTLDAEVDAALGEICCDRRVLPRVLACALDSLGRRDCVPNVSGLVPPHVGERTFYRRWMACIPCRPKHFLDRVRMLHAERLIDGGLEAQEAAFLAGYTSSAQFRAACRKFARAGRNRVDVEGGADRP